MIIIWINIINNNINNNNNNNNNENMCINDNNE